YDTTCTLVIDPSLDFCTYIGGSSWDYVEDHFVGDDGSIYLVGTTESLDFPTTPGVYNRSIGRSDTFVMKVDPDGSSLNYSTFVGGTNASDYGNAIWVDSSGNAYVTGYTRGRYDFPTTAGNYSIDQDFASDVIVFKLNETGSSLIFSNVMGDISTSDHEGRDIHVNDAGEILVMGYTSSGFLTTKDAYQDEGNGHGDAFVIKLDSSGKQLLLGTNLG
ncbi:MAG: hypothetical protein GWN97_03670, partial [Thermoplasmata archaeon]|nr:hypothetical protein [Thermoplasmata archaeon]